MQDKIAYANLKRSRAIKLFLVFLLVVAVILEGYYIYALHDKIEKRNDELKNISVQLQFLKNEREELKAILSSTQKAGDADHGNTTEREY
jgi:predicted Holliday junction resolvase-like endonuclease